MCYNVLTVEAQVPQCREIAYLKIGDLYAVSVSIKVMVLPILPPKNLSKSHVDTAAATGSHSMCRSALRVTSGPQKLFWVPTSFPNFLKEFSQIFILTPRGMEGGGSS